MLANDENTLEVKLIVVLEVAALATVSTAVVSNVSANSKPYSTISFLSFSLLNVSLFWVACNCDQLVSATDKESVSFNI